MNLDSINNEWVFTTSFEALLSAWSAGRPQAARGKQGASEIVGAQTDIVNISGQMMSLHILMEVRNPYSRLSQDPAAFGPGGLLQMDVTFVILKPP